MDNINQFTKVSFSESFDLPRKAKEVEFVIRGGSGGSGGRNYQGSGDGGYSGSIISARFSLDRSRNVITGTFGLSGGAGGYGEYSGGGGGGGGSTTIYLNGERIMQAKGGKGGRGRYWAGSRMGPAGAGGYPDGKRGNGSSGGDGGGVDFISEKGIPILVEGGVSTGYLYFRILSWYEPQFLIKKRWGVWVLYSR